MTFTVQEEATGGQPYHLSHCIGGCHRPLPLPLTILVASVESNRLCKLCLSRPADDGWGSFGPKSWLNLRVGSVLRALWTCPHVIAPTTKGVGRIGTGEFFSSPHWKTWEGVWLSSLRPWAIIQVEVNRNSKRAHFAWQDLHLLAVHRSSRLLWSATDTHIFFSLHNYVLFCVGWSTTYNPHKIH